MAKIKNHKQQEIPHKYGLFFYFIFIRATHFWKLRLISLHSSYPHNLVNLKDADALK